MTHWFELGPT